MISSMFGGQAPIVRSIIIVILVISQVSGGLTFVIWNIHQLSLRQTLTPDILLGRVNASYRFLAWVAIPIDSLIVGGILGTILGLRITLFIGAFGTIAAPFGYSSHPYTS